MSELYWIVNNNSSDYCAGPFKNKEDAVKEAVSYYGEDDFSPDDFFLLSVTTHEKISVGGWKFSPAKPTTIY